MKKILLMVGMFLFLASLTPLANASVLTFDGLSGDVGSTYTEDGFTLTATPTVDGDSLFYSIVAADVVANGLYYTNSETLMNDYTTATTLASADGSAFDLTSIDLAEVFTEDVIYAATIAFDLVYKDGSTYSFDLITDGVEGAETFTFGSELANLASVSFGDSEYIQFDNITASAVPEPSSILLLFVGMGAWAAGARKKLE